MYSYGGTAEKFVSTDFHTTYLENQHSIDWFIAQKKGKGFQKQLVILDSSVCTEMRQLSAQTDFIPLGEFLCADDFSLTSTYSLEAEQSLVR